MPEVPVWQVVVLGIATVFVVLVCIIAICKLMSAVIKMFEKAPVAQVAAPAPVVATTTPVSADKQQILVAISVAIAEQVGVDISKIRIHSIKKV